MRSKFVRIEKKTLRLLSRLLEPNVRDRGEAWISGKDPYVVCLSCGAVDAQSMIKKHKPGCAYILYYKSYDLLKNLLKEIKGA